MRRVGLALTLGLLLSANSVFSQTPTGALEVTIVDSSGGAISAASAVIVNVDTSQQRTVPADSRGLSRFPLLAVGTYRLVVTAAGFADATRDQITIALGQTVRLTITLVPRGVAETVAVAPAASPPVDVRQTA